MLNFGLEALESDPEFSAFDEDAFVQDYIEASIDLDAAMTQVAEGMLTLEQMERASASLESLRGVIMEHGYSAGVDALVGEQLAAIGVTYKEDTIDTAVEGIGESIKNGANKVKEVVIAIFNKIVDMISKLINMNGRRLKKLQALDTGKFADISKLDDQAFPKVKATVIDEGTTDTMLTALKAASSGVTKAITDKKYDGLASLFEEIGYTVENKTIKASKDSKFTPENKELGKHGWTLSKTKTAITTCIDVLKGTEKLEGTVKTANVDAKKALDKGDADGAKEAKELAKFLSGAVSAIASVQGRVASTILTVAGKATDKKGS